MRPRLPFMSTAKYKLYFSQQKSNIVRIYAGTIFNAQHFNKNPSHFAYISLCVGTPSCEFNFLLFLFTASLVIFRGFALCWGWKQAWGLAAGWGGRGRSSSLWVRVWGRFRWWRRWGRGLASSSCMLMPSKRASAGGWMRESESRVFLIETHREFKRRREGLLCSLRLINQMKLIYNYVLSISKA